MITATLTGTTGAAHTLLVKPGPFAIVGMTEPRRREASVRVRAVLASAEGVITVPQGADAASDLAIALSALPALAPPMARGFDAAIGELALTGEVRAVRGIVPRLKALRDSGVHRCIVPASQREAACVPGIEAWGLRALGDTPEPMPAWSWRTPEYPQLDEVLGLDEQKLELRAALAAGRDVLFIREPGAGATMLARRAVGLLPALTDDERLEITTITSSAGLDVRESLGRPFRAPHHTVSMAGLCGGGTPVRPGEVTLAHGGVLFLDELGEFSRAALDALGHSLDRGQTRSGMPARPRVIAACTEKELARIEGTPFVKRFVRIPFPPPVRDPRTGRFPL